MLNDSSVNNGVWAYIAEMSVVDVTALERALLSILNYELHISDTFFLTIYSGLMSSKLHADCAFTCVGGSIWQYPVSPSAFSTLCFRCSFLSVSSSYRFMLFLFLSVN